MNQKLIKINKEIKNVSIFKIIILLKDYLPQPELS